MIHVSLHCCKYRVDNLSLWGFPVKHAVWLHNRIPNRLSGLTPLELLTKTKANHCDLLCTHVRGCLVYVLDPKLQDGQKIPKWDCCSHLNQFLSFSDSHSSLVTNVHHLSIGYVSPQYHLVFDSLFETVFITGNDALLHHICNHLFDSTDNFYFYDNEITSNDPLVYHPPPLDDVWLSEPEHQACGCELENADALLNIVNELSGLIKHLITHLTRFQT